MRLTNKLGLPQPLVDAVLNDDYTRGKADISVTQLISPPRLVTLVGRHWNELEEDVSDRIFSLFGKAIHTILEQAKSANQRAIAERRLFIRVGDWVVSGAMDRIALMGGDCAIHGNELPVGQHEGCGEKGAPARTAQCAGHSIVDYKTAGVNEMIFGVKIEREQQLNVYRALAELNGYKVEKLQAVFILRDWSKVRAAEEAKKPRLGGGEPEYPQRQVVVYDVPLWSTEEAYRYIGERVHLHQQARLPDNLPECTDEERWARQPVLAVMKEGGKRASKIVETEAEGAEYIATHPKDNYTVVARPGESIRCAYYCLALKVCEQGQALLTGAD